MKLKIEYLPTNKLKPYEKNARKHDDADIEIIANSIQKFGFNDAVGIWGKDNLIVEGHGRVLAAKKLGIETIPCVRLDHLSDEERRAYTLAHNKTAEMSEWDFDILSAELESIPEIEMGDFGFDMPEEEEESVWDGIWRDKRDNSSSMRYNAFENQETMQFDTSDNYYGFPVIKGTKTVGNKFLRFCDWKECDNPAEYIAHFYYDDFKFMSAWREPDKYIDRLRAFKAVVAPDFSLYTDFPRALQILSAYRRQWCAAYWEYKGIDVIPCAMWGEEDTFEWCFDGIPKGSVVSCSTVGTKKDKNWNGKDDSLFLKGYKAMMEKLEPSAILFYGKMIEGCEGNIIRIPSYYEQKFEKGK